jgi:hypothetical protein
MCNNCIKGCGKTTLAKKLAKTWKCELVNGTLNRNARGGPLENGWGPWGENKKRVPFKFLKKIQHKQTAGKKFMQLQAENPHPPPPITFLIISYFLIKARIITIPIMEIGYLNVCMAFTDFSCLLHLGKNPLVQAMDLSTELGVKVSRFSNIN